MTESITDVTVSGSALSELDNQIPEYPIYSEVDEAVKAIWPAAIDKVTDTYNLVYYNDSEADNRARAEGDFAKYQNIGDNFTQLYERLPAAAATKAASLREAKEPISSAQLGTPVAQLVEELNDWAGLARDSFADNFAYPLIDGAITSQQAVLEELAVAMISYEGVLRAGAKDAKALADKAVEVIESMGDFSTDDFVQDALAVKGIAGSIVAAAAAPQTLGLPLVFGLLNVGVEYSTTAADSWAIRGDNMYAILDDVIVAAGALVARMTAEEQAIADKLTDTLANTRAILDSTDPEVLRRLLPHEPAEPDGTRPVPNLTDGKQPGPGGFHPEQ